MFRTSSRCGSGSCISCWVGAEVSEDVIGGLEIVITDGHPDPGNICLLFAPTPEQCPYVHVMDTKDPDGPILNVPQDVWVMMLRAYEYDHQLNFHEWFEDFALRDGVPRFTDQEIRDFLSGLRLNEFPVLRREQVLAAA